MKQFLFIILLSTLICLGMTDATAQQDPTCAPDAVVKSFGAAVATGNLESWLDDYKNGNCSNEIKAGAQGLYDAYTQMLPNAARVDECTGKLTLCNLFADAAQFMDAEVSVFAGNNGSVTHEFTEQCAKSGTYGLLLTYNTVGKDQYGGFAVDWAKSPAKMVDLSPYQTFSVWARAVGSKASFQIGLLDSVLSSGSEPRVETTSWVVITDKDWVPITFPIKTFNVGSVILKSSQILNVSFGFNSNHGAGQVCIDDLAFIP